MDFTGFAWVQEILERPGILFWHFQSWKIHAGPRKSWKSINSSNKVFFKNNFLQYYFWISIL